MVERTKVVIVGGGVAALEGALALQALGPEALDVELVAAPAPPSIPSRSGPYSVGSC